MDLHTSTAQSELSNLAALLRMLKADTAKLTLQHAAKVETELYRVRGQLDALQAEVRGIRKVVESLGARFDVAVQVHERLAALEAQVEHLPPRRRDHGGNGRFQL